MLTLSDLTDAGYTGWVHDGVPTILQALGNNLKVLPPGSLTEVGDLLLSLDDSQLWPVSHVIWPHPRVAILRPVKDKKEKKGPKPGSVHFHHFLEAKVTLCVRHLEGPTDGLGYADVTVGWAIAHPKDQFSRKNGRRIAEGRAMNDDAAYFGTDQETFELVKTLRALEKAGSRGLIIRKKVREFLGLVERD